MKRKLVLANWFAVLGGGALLLMVVCMSAQAQTESKPSEQLIAAAKNGSLEEVQRLIDVGAHLPGTLSSFQAIKFAKDEGHDEIFELLQAGLNEYMAAGTYYDNLIEGYVEDLRTRAEEDPGAIRWKLSKRLTTSLTIDYHNGLKNDPDGLLYPLGVAFDEKEFRRRFDPAFEALQEEYQVESDYERKSREMNEIGEAMDALVKERNQGKIDDEEFKRKSREIEEALDALMKEN